MNQALYVHMNNKRKKNKVGKGQTILQAILAYLIQNDTPARMISLNPGSKDFFMLIEEDIQKKVKFTSYMMSGKLSERILWNRHHILPA
jgi:hypothetical protein